jgi:D-alanyl-D-alanine carboxypeptidase
MTRTRTLTTLFLIAASLVAGCSSGTSSTEEDPDGITAEELQAGENSTGEDGSEPDDETDGDPYAELEADEKAEAEEGTTSEALSDCRNTTGYRRGRKIQICVTPIAGKLVEVHTAQAFRRLQEAARADGVKIRIVSGYRTMTRQRELYRAYKAGRGNLAAVPGFSNHQSGKALDLNASSPGVYTWLARNGTKLGFRRTVAKERWHWED